MCDVNLFANEQLKYESIPCRNAAVAYCKPSCAIHFQWRADIFHGWIYKPVSSWWSLFERFCSNSRNKVCSQVTFGFARLETENSFNIWIEFLCTIIVTFLGTEHQWCEDPIESSVYYYFIIRPKHARKVRKLYIRIRTGENWSRIWVSEVGVAKWLDSANCTTAPHSSKYTRLQPADRGGAAPGAGLHVPCYQNTLKLF